MLLAFASVLAAESRFYVEPQSLPLGGRGEELPLRLDNDEPVRGYVFAVRFEPARLAVTAVERTGTIAEDAEFFAGEIDGPAGTLAFGCVFSLASSDSSLLAAGAGRLLVKLVADVTGAAGDSTALAFADVSLDPSRPELPPARNILTNAEGFTVLPALVGGTIAIVDRTPQIASLSGNAGRPGTVFRVAGSHFDEPELAVTVCGVPAEAALEPDGTTLLVTAPECGSIGPVPVAVCTRRGCDEAPGGFD